MSDHVVAPREVETHDARTPWTDPSCTEYAVEELTQAGGPGVTDSGILS
ncbi:hypothetical protein [Sphingomonas sp.]|jgi:hypothetical protein|nr:hypothetical protein [Sphingomonas sp.]